MEAKTIILIGAGNLATHTAAALHKAGHRIGQVYSRTEQSARTLAEHLGCPYTTDTESVSTEGDLYLFALKDDVLPEIISRIKPNDALWVHTSGSTDMQVFSPHVTRYGVFYPLQTFSKTKPVDFDEIPIFVEAAHESDTGLLETLARTLSRQVNRVTSEQRRAIHLAAVFACNFTNHLYAIAAHLLEAQQLPFQVLLPLIRETAAKVETLDPQKAQTGPAIRYDRKIIERHLQLLAEEPELCALYESLSRNIHQYGLKADRT